MQACLTFCFICMPPLRSSLSRLYQKQQNKLQQRQYFKQVSTTKRTSLNVQTNKLNKKIYKGFYWNNKREGGNNNSGNTVCNEYKIPYTILLPQLVIEPLCFRFFYLSTKKKIIYRQNKWTKLTLTTLHWKVYNSLMVKLVAHTN